MNSATVQRTNTQASNIAKGFNITEGLTVHRHYAVLCNTRVYYNVKKLAFYKCLHAAA